MSEEYAHTHTLFLPYYQPNSTQLNLLDDPTHWLTDLSQRAKRMLFALEANLDSADSGHFILEFGADAQHGFAVHCFGGPVVRAADDALHAAFGARHEEADGGPLGGEEGCCHAACTNGC